MNIEALYKIAQSEQNSSDQRSDQLAKVMSLSTVPAAAALDYRAVSTIPEYLKAENAIRPLNEHPSMANQPQRFAAQAKYLSDAADWYEWITKHSPAGKLPEGPIGEFARNNPSVVHETPIGYCVAHGDPAKIDRYRKESKDITERIAKSNSEMQARRAKAKAVKGKLKGRGSIAAGSTLLSLLANYFTFGSNRTEQLPSEADRIKEDMYR